MGKAHAKLSASGSGQWLNCPGSIKAQESYKNESSIYAIEGTQAHEVADICLKENQDADAYIGVEVLGEKVSAEMARYVQEYLDYVRAHEVKNSQLYTEERVDFSHVVPEGFGTMDAAVLDYDTGVCHIFDLKYGRGVQVYAFENTQSQLYALGLLNELGFLDAIKSFRIHIVQPRKVTPEPWDISVEDLQQFGKYATERAELALTNSAPRVPGDKQCMWCAAKGDCEALAKFCEEIISAEFDDLDGTASLDPSIIPEFRKKTILDNKKLIESFLSAVEGSVFQEIADGGKFAGYKIVHGKSNRVWTDKAEKWLSRKIGANLAFKKSLIGITAAEKILGKGKIDRYVEKPEGKPTLVIETDKRAPIKFDVSDEFDELEEEL